MRIILTTALVLLGLLTAEVPEIRYYIGSARVDEALWLSVPDSAIRSKEYVEYDSVTVENIYLTPEYKLDSISVPGSTRLVRRSAEEIAMIMSLITGRASGNELRVQTGDTVPQFTLIKNPGGATVENVIRPGKCYLINFWATWCGNCLQELLPDELPALADKYIDNKHFIFLPVCIDSQLDEMERFFASDNGERWAFLKYLTYLDPERDVNALFGEPGRMPLTIVVGPDGTVRYAKHGRLANDADYEKLERVIDECLAETD